MFKIFDVLSIFLFIAGLLSLFSGELGTTVITWLSAAIVNATIYHLNKRS